MLFECVNSHEPEPRDGLRRPVQSQCGLQPESQLSGHLPELAGIHADVALHLHHHQPRGGLPGVAALRRAQGRAAAGALLLQDNVVRAAQPQERVRQTEPHELPVPLARGERFVLAIFSAERTHHPDSQVFHHEHPEAGIRQVCGVKNEVGAQDRVQAVREALRGVQGGQALLRGSPGEPLPGRLADGQCLDQDAGADSQAEKSRETVVEFRRDQEGRRGQRSSTLARVGLLHPLLGPTQFR